MSVQDGIREPLSVVIIDDDRDHIELLTQFLESARRQHWPAGLKLLVFTDPADALANLPPGESIILCDYSLGGSCALDWMADFVRAGCGPVILLTSSGSEHIATQAFRQGVADYLVKSVVFDQPDVLVRSIKEALRRHRLERRNHDLSRQLKVLNAELVEKNKTLADLTDTAHRFVDDVAHEFRTPLAVIREFTSIINDKIGGEITAKQSEYLKHIDEASRDLATLVDDFLDTSRLRARTLRVDRAAHTVAQLFESVRSPLVLRAASKGISLRESIEPDLPRIFTDLEKTKRVLTNLVINAVKFSPAGSEILLSARRADQHSVEISVHDQGCGMSASDLSTIFRRFEQKDQARRAGVKGFGLGLSIANELTLLNLGRMRVNSEIGKGSQFAFTLPVDNRTSIVQRYFEHICTDAGARYVTLLKAVPVDRTMSIDDARAELVGVCYPWDLVLPNLAEGSLCIFGTTGEPDSWIDGLERGLIEGSARRPGHEPGASAHDRCPLRLTLVGCWEPERARGIVLTRTLHEPAKEVPLAA
jgi:signal transduction histidine kinase